MDNNTNTTLISFLRNLADSLETNQLSKKQNLRIGEFFMEYKFQEAAYKDEKQFEENEENELEDLHFDKSELIKFLSLGWYIYCVILKDKTL